MTAVATARAPEVLPPIACPDWCTSSKLEHLANLDNLEGRCVHYSADVEIACVDHGPTQVHLSVMTWFDGSPNEEPLIDIDGRLYTVEGARRLATELLALVEVAGS